MKHFLITSFFLICISYSSFSFQKNNQLYKKLELELAEWQMKRAIEFSENHQFDSAIYCYKKSQKISVKNKNFELLVKSIYNEGKFYYKNKMFEKSLTTYEKALKYAEKYLLNKDNSLILTLYNKIGLNYWKFKKFHASERVFNNGISLLKKIKDIKEFAYLFLNLARTYDHLDDLNKSLEYWDKSYLYLERYKMKDMFYAYYYDNKGDILLRKERFDEVIKYKLKALEIYKKLNKQSGIIGCYDFLGRVHYKKKEYDQALELYRKAISLVEKYKKNGNSKLDWQLPLQYVNIGKIYSAQSKFEEAQYFFLKSYKLNKTIRNNKITYLTKRLGENHLRLQNYDSALLYFQEDLTSENYEFESNNIYENPSNILATEYKYDYLKVLALKAKAFRLKYSFQPKSELINLKTAYETNKLATELIDTIFNEYSSSNSKLDWTDNMFPIYEEAIRTSFELYKHIKEISYLKNAFELMEKSKAGILYDELKSSKAKSYSEIPDSLLNEEQSLKRQLAHMKTKLNYELARKDKNDTTKVNDFKEKKFSLKRKIEALEKHLEIHYPKYHQLKYSSNKIEIHRIRNEILDDKTTLIEYFSGDSVLLAFMVNKERFEIVELPKIENLQQKVKVLPQYLLKKDKENFSKLSFELYQKLFKPLGIKTENLIVIPDGHLWHLNFDLLIKSKPKKLDYRKFEYLINDFTISYSYSAKLLMQDLEVEVQQNKNECIAFSYNNPDDVSVGNFIAMKGYRNSKLGDLPGTRKEIKAVSSVMDGAYYFGSYANEKNFKENAKDYSILHLALHGVIDNNDPMNSKLYFTQNLDSVEDNYLHAYELYSTNLNAELAVLSACQTGSGKLIKGEGIMSLGRAFTYAGCKSLVLSQWDVSDAFTPIIMKSFYENLKKGKTKAAALREAKLLYLAKADNLTSNPYYWAPLIQLGDNRPLKQDTIISKILIGIGIMSILLIIGFVFRKRMFKKI